MSAWGLFWAQPGSFVPGPCGLEPNQASILPLSKALSGLVWSPLLLNHEQASVSPQGCGCHPSSAALLTGTIFSFQVPWTRRTPRTDGPRAQHGTPGADGGPDAS